MALKLVKREYYDISDVLNYSINSHSPWYLLFREIIFGKHFEFFTCLNIEKELAWLKRSSSGVKLLVSNFSVLVKISNYFYQGFQKINLFYRNRFEQNQVRFGLDLTIGNAFRDRINKEKLYNFYIIFAI